MKGETMIFLALDFFLRFFKRILSYAHSAVNEHLEMLLVPVLAVK